MTIPSFPMADPADRLTRALEQHRLGRIAEAEAGYRAVLAHRPDDADALHLLGMLLAQAGRAEEAERMVARAAAFSPAAADMQVTLGAIRRALGRADAAEAALRTALTLDPGASQACLHLGCLMQQRGRADEAESLLSRAVAGDPGLGDAWHRLGRLAEDRDDPARAADCLEQALAAGAVPRAAILARLMRQLTALGRWERHAELMVEVRAALEDDRDGTVPPHLLIDLPLVPDWHVRAARAHAIAWQRAAGGSRPAAFRQGEGRLRIGYLCDDLRRHPMLQRIVSVHDRSTLDPLVFALETAGAGFPIRYSSLVGETAEGMVHRLSSAALDVLVLLDAFGVGFQPAIAAARPAPLIVHWPGHPGTLGGLADYILADPVLVPPGGDRYHAEAVVRLPVLPAAVPADSPARAADAEARRAAGLPLGAVVFAAWHPPYRINRALLAGWLRILEGCPDGVLWLPSPPVETARVWLGTAAAAGIDPRRVILAEPGTVNDDGALKGADLFLDSRPVGAGRMAARALAAGVPVLGWSGEMLAGRQAAGLLTALGFGDLAAASAPAHEAMAIALGRDRAALSALRVDLAMALGRAGGPFDPVLAGRALEAAFTAMADRARSGLPPVAFTIQRVGGE